MTAIKDIEHVLVYKDPDMAHATNQVSMVVLQNGEVFWPLMRRDHPFTPIVVNPALLKSKDGGKSWILPPNRLSGLILKTRAI